jgi:hypothetical protein
MSISLIFLPDLIAHVGKDLGVVEVKMPVEDLDFPM